MDEITQWSIWLFLGITVLVYLMKPRCFFNENNTLKQFGTGDDKTLFSFHLFLVLMAPVSYYLVLVFNKMFDGNMKMNETVDQDLANLLDN